MGGRQGRRRGRRHRRRRPPSLVAIHAGDGESNRTTGSCQPDFSNLYPSYIPWGGWGSNPRPADYKKHGFVHRTRYLHGYHGAVPPMALIALMARSTNRSTHSIVITGCRYRTLL